MEFRKTLAPVHGFERRGAGVFLAGALTVAIGLASACSSENSAATFSSSCPNDLPGCPGMPPSYSSQVVGVISRRCSPCHESGGAAGPSWNFSSYAGAYARRAEILNQVYACTMPPHGNTPLTSLERATLLAWLVCRAPNN